MKHIVKGAEPDSLTIHRTHKHSDYDNYRDKDALRDLLLAEQGKICCYCMRRIKKYEMKIEHWASQNKYPAKQLDYNNLLASCNGGEGYPRHLQHCDTRKGEDDIIINPADRNHNCEKYICYGSDGTIYSNNYQINEDLDKALNLNIQMLCNNRKSVLDGAIDGLRRKRPDGAWTRAFLEREIQAWEKRNLDEELLEYSMVVVSHLQKKLARLN